MNNNNDNDAVTVMVVDDDTIDRMAIHRSFKKLRLINPIIEASDGIDALDHLRGLNGHKKPTVPLVILLDLNMPRMGGIEFLEEIRNDPELKPLLIFVLTTSKAQADRIRAYAKNIAGYVLKQAAGHSFLESIEALSRYWHTIELPDPVRH
jgi:CheY-like chemotaxis protein